MDTKTGQIITQEQAEALNRQEPGRARTITRDLTLKERSSMQIGLYAECGCGSGKKFKFCCRKP